MSVTRRYYDPAGNLVLGSCKVGTLLKVAEAAAVEGDDILEELDQLEQWGEGAPAAWDTGVANLSSGTRSLTRRYPGYGSGPPGPLHRGRRLARHHGGPDSPQTFQDGTSASSASRLMVVNGRAATELAY